MLAVGLMSGTSLDGVDAALVAIEPTEVAYRVRLLRFQTHPFTEHLQAQLRAVLPPNEGSVAELARLHHALGGAYGDAASAIAGPDTMAFVASHGQTVWHDGAAGVTLQIGDPFAIRERVNATVCYDFRSADCAAGGHGAPLVARVDALLLSSADEDRVALNLGGIANVTLLRRGAAPEEAVAFDTGPANMLLDEFVRMRTGGACRCDQDGKLAAAGRVERQLLDAMLADRYFSSKPPKTTGREKFGQQFLAAHDDIMSRLSIEDGAATLLELTVETVREAIARAGFAGARVVVSGGGAHNPVLLGRLAARLAPAVVERSDAMGLPADAKEAMAFAVLGYELLRGRPANVPLATGARQRVVLGAIAPHHIGRLLAGIASECRSFT